MALFPIYGHFDGDFVPHLVAIDTENTMAEVAEAVAVHSVGRRIAKDQSATGYETLVKGTLVPLQRRFSDVMAELNVAPLDFVLVRFGH